MQEKTIALLREVESERSGLSPEKRATRRREIDELPEELRRGGALLAARWTS